jgi:mannose-1-phosphate guanylyltransferase/phosphomannomutase
MVPVLGKPVMEYGIELLRSYGIERMAVTTQYLPGQIMNYFWSGEKQGVRLHYFVENTPLGTAGSVRNAMSCITEPFVILSGDALVDINLEKACAFHRKKGAKLTIVLKQSPEPVRFGVVILDRSGRVVRFQEKPSWDEVFSDLVNTGIYLMEPELMDEVPEGKPYDFSKDLFPRLLAAGCPMYGYVTEEYWCDIGSPEQYRLAHEDFLTGKIHLNVGAREVKPGIFLKGHPLVHSTATLLSPCYVGEDVYIGAHACVGPGAAVGRGSQINERASVKRSVLWDNVLIDSGAEIRGAILCSDVKVGSGSRIFEGATVGARTTIGEDVHVHGGVQIWPEKIIENYDQIREDIVWNHGQRKKIITEGRIEGWVNRDINPEYIASVSGAFAGLHRPESRIGLCNWGSKASSAILNGLKASLSLIGLNCDVMEDAPANMLRYAIRRNGLAGGIHIASGRGKWRMSFYDAYGCALDKKDTRSMESALSHTLTQPVRDGRIGDIVPVAPLVRQYTRMLKKEVDSVLSAMDLVCEDEDLGQYVVRQLEKCGYAVRFVKGDQFPGQGGKVAVKIAGFGDTILLRDEDRRVLTPMQTDTLRAMMARKYLPGRLGGIPVSPIFPRELILSLQDGGQGAGETGYMASSWLHGIAEGLEDRTLITLLEGPAFLVTLDRMLTEEGTNLSEFIDRMPAGAVRERQVHCPGECRGNIMRA